MPTRYLNTYLTLLRKPKLGQYFSSVGAVPSVTSNTTSTLAVRFS